MKLAERTKELTEEMNELKVTLVAECVKSNDIDDLTDENIVAIAKVIKMFDTSMKLVVEQAEMLDSMSVKLDKLLSKVG